MNFTLEIEISLPTLAAAFQTRPEQKERKWMLKASMHRLGTQGRE